MDIRHLCVAPFEERLPCNALIKTLWQGDGSLKSKTFIACRHLIELMSTELWRCFQTPGAMRWIDKACLLINGPAA